MRESRIKKQARESSIKNGAGNLDYVVYLKYSDKYSAAGYSETFVRVCKGHKEPDGIPASRVIEKILFRGGLELQSTI